MLDDSAPRGEELPGDGDWNTARGTDSSEDLRAVASSHRAELPREDCRGRSLFGKKNCQPQLSRSGHASFQLHLFKGVLQLPDFFFPQANILKKIQTYCRHQT